MRQCALRKGLGVAAYAVAVGEYLATLDRAFSSCQHLGGSVTDVIPRVDLANEMDSFSYNVDPPPNGDEEGTIYEMGRFAALLAGPITDQGLGIRFRMFDLFGFTEDEVVRPKLTWLKYCITVGMGAETERWARLYGCYQTDAPDWLVATLADLAQKLSLGEVSEDDYWWVCAMYDTGFVWPRSHGHSSTALVHHVGFHFFRSVTKVGPRTDYGPAPDSDEGERYKDEQAIGELAELMVAVVVNPLREARYDMAWSIGAMCFPALAPDPIDGDRYFADEAPEDPKADVIPTNPEYQAGFLARRVLYAKALPDGPDMVTWYTFMATIAKGDEIRDDDETWGLYTATGLRNEVYGAVPGGQQTARIDDVTTVAEFSYNDDAFRRSSWYTLRRVAWLLQRAERVEFLYQNDHRYVLRLTATHSFEEELRLFDATDAEETPWREASEGWSPPASQQERPSASSADSVAHKYAYVAWFDQQPCEDKSPHDSFSFWLADASEGGYQLLPLVPEVTYDMGCGDTDANGYPECETVTWGDGFTAATVQEEEKLGGFTVLEVNVPRASPDNPGPVCVLCNADMFSSLYGHFPRESPFRNQLAELLQEILAGPDAPDPDRFRLVTELYRNIQSTW